MSKEIINDFTLPSGIRCVHKRVKSAALYCAMTVNGGTRDELEGEHGIAHLIEHLLFKGTSRRKPHHINSLLDNRGGEINAFTTKEETVLHAVSLKGDFARSVDLISDVLFNSTFPENELRKEISIILDEINSYKDSPSELIFDDFEDMLFSGSSLGRNILGSPSVLKKFKRDDLHRFISRCYNSDQMVFSAVGDISFSRFEQVCRTYFGDIAPSPRSFERSQAPVHMAQDRVVNKRTHQAHCMMGGYGYSHKDPRRVTLALLNNILGGVSANSRLNVSLREKSALVYNIESGYTSYSDTGVTSIYFGTDKDNLDYARELVHKEIRKMCDNSLSSLALATAKRQLLGQLLISSESGESSMLSMGKSMLLYNTVDTIDKIYDKVNSISSEQLLDVANHVFREGNISTLIYK